MTQSATTFLYLPKPNFETDSHSTTTSDSSNDYFQNQADSSKHANRDKIKHDITIVINVSSENVISDQDDDDQEQAENDEDEDGQRTLDFLCTLIANDLSVQAKRLDEINHTRVASQSEYFTFWYNAPQVHSEDKSAMLKKLLLSVSHEVFSHEEALGTHDKCEFSQNCVVYAFQLIQKMMFNNSLKDKSKTLFIHSQTAERVLAVACLIAFKMLTENDCLIQANVRMADLLDLSVDHLNKMERKFFQAIDFDAGVPYEEVQQKLSAVNVSFIASLVNNEKQTDSEISSEKFQHASKTDSSTLASTNNVSARAETLYNNTVELEPAASTKLSPSSSSTTLSN